MRIVAGVFCALMILFAAVQYNDPDGLFWGVVYGGAAFWCGMAALGQAGRPLARGLHLVSLLLALFGVWWFWPRSEGFWRMDVWWETETAREGLGIMIVLLALVVAWVAGRPRGGLPGA